MITKLTLTVDKEVIDAAKKYSKMKGKSISQLVENYLKTIVTHSDVQSRQQFSPRVNKLRGAIQLPKDFDYKKSLSSAITNKFKQR